MSSSKCANCGKCYKDSKAVLKKSDEPVIALLGQPNSGKSSIFNMMTGSHQHTKFDKIATTRIGGKIIAVGVFLLIFLVSMIFAGIVSGVCGSAISKESLLGVLNTLYCSDTFD